MTAEVLPFPLARRSGLIQRIAEHASGLKPDKAEQYFQRQFQCQVDALRRRGVSEQAITRELAGMESAIGAAMWNVVFSRPGGAS